MGLLFWKKSRFRGTVYFPYARGYKISWEAAQWIADHIVSADYDYSLDSHLTIHYISDGTPPPKPRFEDSAD